MQYSIRLYLPCVLGCAARHLRNSSCAQRSPKTVQTTLSVRLGLAGSYEKAYSDQLRLEHLRRDQRGKHRR